MNNDNMDGVDETFVSEEEFESEDDEEILISSEYIKEKIEEVVDKYVKINPSLSETLNLLKQDLIREVELVEESYDEFESDVEGFDDDFEEDGEFETE